MIKTFPRGRLAWITLTLVGMAVLATAIRRPASRTALAREATGYRVDLNQAGPGTIALLPGIGARLAVAVVEYRSFAGPFSTVEALVAVRGIGARTVERLKPFAVCGGEME